MIMGTWQAWGWIVALAVAVAGLLRLSRTMNRMLAALRHEHERTLRATDAEVIIQMRMAHAATRKGTAEEFAAATSLDEVKALCQKIASEPDGRYAPGEMP